MLLKRSSAKYKLINNDCAAPRFRYFRQQVCFNRTFAGLGYHVFVQLEQNLVCLSGSYSFS